MTAPSVRWPNFADKFRALLQRQGVTLYRISEDTPLKNSNMTRVAAGPRACVLGNATLRKAIINHESPYTWAGRQPRRGRVDFRA